jgi:signal transduction histidine kinase
LVKWIRRSERDRPPRLVTRFALSSLVAFVAIGAVFSLVVSNELRARQEQAAEFHAEFVTNSILHYLFTPKDLEKPMDVHSARYARILADVKQRVLQAPVVRVKVWDRNGTIVFSDQPDLVGRNFGAESDIANAMHGISTAGVSDLRDPENIDERGKFQKLYETYVPFRLDPTEPPVAVAELYTDYAGIQREVDRLERTVTLALIGGLAALYVFLLPLARRVTRTMAGQNEQLEQQAKRLRQLLGTEQQRVADLQEVNRMKDEFVAVASHELRTPLTSIIGYAKTLRRPEFAGDAAVREEFLGAIERQGDRLSRLVKNLLNAASIEQEKNRVQVSSMSFEDLVREVVAGLGGQASRVRVDIAADLPPVVTDRARIELIVANLLDNALKFSSGGECGIRATRERDDLVFTVWDRGVGIPADQLPQIFERFYQVDSSITRQYGGVGLGLNLVKELVRSLDGSVTVESEPERGSTFTVRIPMNHQQASSQPDPNLAAYPLGSGGQPLARVARRF